MTKPGPDDKIYPVAKIAVIVEALASEGVPMDDALAGVGITKHEATLSATRVSRNQILECCRNAISLSLDDPHLAHRAGQLIHVATYGLYGFAMLSSMDFRQTMRFVTQYGQLVGPLTETTFHEAGQYGVWTITPLSHPNIEARLDRFLVELQISTYISLLRDCMGPGFNPHELHFTFAPPTDASAYSETFGCTVLFDQSKSGFTFDSAWLDKKPEFGNEMSYLTLVKLCDALLEELNLHIGLVGRVRKIILVNLMKPKGFEEIARRLGMSARTLRRKLAEENTSFRELMDDLRKELAIRYLRETALTVEDIAHMLGFSDSAHFRQSFRRWTKWPPSRYRDVANAPQQSQ